MSHCGNRYFPQEDAEYVLDTDACDYGIGGVLLQKVDAGRKVVAHRHGESYIEGQGNRVVDRGKESTRNQIHCEETQGVFAWVSLDHSDGSSTFGEK